MVEGALVVVIDIAVVGSVFADVGSEVVGKIVATVRIGAVGGIVVAAGVDTPGCSNVIVSDSSSHVGGVSESQTITVNDGDNFLCWPEGSTGAVPDSIPRSDKEKPCDLPCPGNCDPGFTAQ